MAERVLFTSESVTEGHPDKLADQISDAVLDALLQGDPLSRVAVETMVAKGLVIVAGEVTTKAYADVRQIVRNTVADVGYDKFAYGFDGATCGVLTSIDEQSPDIKIGVDEAYEQREGGALARAAGIPLLGAGDQGMMFGYACDETEDLMPLPITLAHRLTRKLADARKGVGCEMLPWLRPDGKSQVTVEYRDGRPLRVDAVVVSCQHTLGIDLPDLRSEVRDKVIRPAIPADLLDEDTRIYVNPTGRFIVGGPMADTGVTGRKVEVDSYGSMSRHGGGALSGKDPTKVDRSGAYAARHVAKNIVGAGLASRCEVQISYAIGVAEPVAIAVETFGTNRVDNDLIRRLVRRHFDLRPGSIIERLRLRRPIYRPLAAYGHFGRPELDLPWERLDVAAILRRDAG